MMDIALIQATIGHLAVDRVYYSQKTKKLLVRLDDSTSRQGLIVLYIALRKKTKYKTNEKRNALNSKHVQTYTNYKIKRQPN